jgi:glycosyltransferase involved in cell wall biosynthesis
MNFSHNQRAADERISVLHFTNSMLWGGVEQHICALLRTISRDLFRPHLVCDPVLYQRFRDAIPGDIELTPLALSSPKHIGSAARLGRMMRRQKFHIVHSHMFWSSLFASPIAWACRVPAIVETLHGTEAWRSGWKASGVIDRATTGFVSRYVAVCESDARFLQNRKRVDARKISIIHNGIDARPFSKTRAARNSIRQSLGISETDPVVIMVARFHAGKGHRVLLEAIRQLVHVHPRVKLVCLGEGEGELEVREDCERFGLRDRVFLAGYQANVAEWLAAADMNVLPSFYEGLPLTVLEAMASGLPTVASNVGGIPEAIEDGVSGLLVPPGDHRRLASALSILVSDPARRVQMGQAARQCLLQKFVLEQQVRSTEKMYFELCGAEGTRRSDATDAHCYSADEESLSSILTRPQLTRLSLRENSASSQPHKF